MLKFLRRIRQKLIIDGNLNRYLLYAIGEILLVMVGILLALQVNNWNQSNKDSLLENLYIERLIFEIKKDTSFFKREIASNEKRNDAIRKFTSELSNPKGLDSVLLKEAHDFFAFGWFLPNFTVAKSTFNDLSSTGQLSLINNVKLRDELIAYYASYEDILTGFEGNKHWLLPIDGKLSTETNALQYDPITRDIFGQSKDVGDLRSNSEFYKRVAV